MIGSPKATVSTRMSWKIREPRLVGETEEDSGAVESATIRCALEIHRLHIFKVADKAENLARIIGIVRVVFQSVDGHIVDPERSALNRVDDRTLGNRLKTGSVADLRWNEHASGQGVADRRRQSVVDREAPANLRARRRRQRRNDFRAGARADKELPVSTHRDAIVIPVGD